MCSQALKSASSPPSSLLSSLQAHFSSCGISAKEVQGRNVFKKSIISFQDYFPGRKTQKTKFTAFESNSALQVLCENYVFSKSTGC